MCDSESARCLIHCGMSLEFALYCLNPIPKREWIVSPPIKAAAAPVFATIATFLLMQYDLAKALMHFKICDFPVPLPSLINGRHTLGAWRTYQHINSCNAPYHRACYYL